MGDANNALHTTASTANLGPVFLGVDYAAFSISTIVVLIRLFTRGWITRNIGWDDATMFLTQAITAVGKGFVITEVSYGLGKHRTSLSVENYRNYLKYYYLDTAQFFIALATCKISICLFLLRLTQFNKLRRFLWSLIGFLIISHLVLFLLVVLQCDPVRKAWDLGVPGKCFSQNTVMNINIVQGVLSFVTDFICAAFPVYLLRNLKIRRRSYIGLCFLMGLGVATGLIAIARTATTYQIKAWDTSWVTVPNSMTRIFEVNIGNIAACVPILKPFSRYVYAKATRRDPHQVLQRKSSEREFHWRWYGWSWQISSLRFGKKYHKNDQHETDLPIGVVKMIPQEMTEKPSQAKTTRTKSIELPLQGARTTYGDGEEEEVPYVSDMRDSQRFHSGETPQRHSWKLYGAKDIV